MPIDRWTLLLVLLALAGILLVVVGTMGLERPAPSRVRMCRETRELDGDPTLARAAGESVRWGLVVSHFGYEQDSLTG